MNSPPAGSHEHPPSSWRAFLGQLLSLAISLTVTVAVLLLLLWSPFGGSEEETKEEKPAADAVQITGTRTLTINPGSVLAKKIAVDRAELRHITAPVLTVTGSIVARLAGGTDPVEGRWDFNSPELANAYSDWIKARADAVSAKEQLTKIKDLTTARVSAAKEVAERLRDLVKAGSDPLKDLRAAEAELRLAVLQGQKDVFEAETTLNNAIRSRATLERQMFQAGLDPALLGKIDEAEAIVVADVPEAKVGLVQQGLPCVARFFAFKGSAFEGKVGSLSPSLSRERRTLRVFFEVKDPQNKLKPGMFAEIGLNATSREVLLVPADAVLHVSRADYVLTGGDRGAWRIVEVTVGEVHRIRAGNGDGERDEIEVHAGLRPNEPVLGSGAILLKPLVVRALQSGT